jgi:hypothetical protein
MRYYIYNSGKFTSTSPTTIPNYPGVNFTITFNQLTNPTTKYSPAVGFVDLDYLLIYNQNTYIIAISYIPTSTAFKMFV